MRVTSRKIKYDKVRNKINNVNTYQQCSLTLKLTTMLSYALGLSQFGGAFEVA